MYPVSAGFLAAAKANTRRYYWTGRITTKSGIVYDFGPGDIVRGSGYISSQCCGSTEIELGSVYAAEMGISLFSDVDRYTLMDAEVTLDYHLRISGSRRVEDLDPRYRQTVEFDGIYETVPMGIFEVSEANRRVRTLEIKGYDYMLRFERTFRALEAIGTAYDFMTLCALACNVELEQSRQEIEALANGQVNLAIYEENDIETYRDVLFFVAQVLGGFFVVNRAGKLELRKYGNEPVLEVERTQRFTSSFSDFVTRYTAVSSTNMRTQIAEYYALATDDGLTMNLGINPLMQFGLPATRQTICRNILNDLAVVNYVPFESDTIGNMALDVGDVISFSGGQADANTYACVTSNGVKIGGKQTIKCVGKNPKLSQAKSKNDKNISGLLAQIEKGKIGIHTFTNAAAFAVGVNDVKIISIEFATMEKNHMQFFGQVIVDVTADAGASFVDAVFEYELNNQRIPVHMPQERWVTGRHTILLYYPIEDVIPNYSNVFNVYMRCSGGSAVISEGMCIASISGQNMAAESAWDGRIDEEEYVERFEFGNREGNEVLKARGFTENDSWRFYQLSTETYTETLTGKPQIGGFAVVVDVNSINQ